MFGSPSCVRHVCLHYTYTQTDRKTCRARKETIGIGERAKNMFVLVYSTKTLIWPCLIDPHSPFASVRCKQLAQPIVGGPVRVNITLAYNSLFLFFLTTTIRFHFVSGGPNRSMSENRSRQGIPKRWIENTHTHRRTRATPEFDGYLPSILCVCSFRKRENSFWPSVLSTKRDALLYWLGWPVWHSSRSPFFREKEIIGICHWHASAAFVDIVNINTSRHPLEWFEKEWHNPEEWHHFLFLLVNHWVVLIPEDNY